MIRRPPRSTLDRSSAASDVYKRQAAGVACADRARGEAHAHHRAHFAQQYHHAAREPQVRFHSATRAARRGMARGDYFVTTPLVIGLGNDFRRDDGAGRVAARRVRELAGDAVRVIEESGEGAALMDAWRGAELVV